MSPGSGGAHALRVGWPATRPRTRDVARTGGRRSAGRVTVRRRSRGGETRGCAGEAARRRAAAAGGHYGRESPRSPVVVSASFPPLAVQAGLIGPCPTNHLNLKLHGPKHLYVNSLCIRPFTSVPQERRRLLDRPGWAAIGAGGDDCRASRLRRRSGADSWTGPVGRQSEPEATIVGPAGCAVEAAQTPGQARLGGNRSRRRRLSG